MHMHACRKQWRKLGNASWSAVSTIVSPRRSPGLREASRWVPLVKSVAPADQPKKLEVSRLLHQLTAECRVPSVVYWRYELMAVTVACDKGMPMLLSCCMQTRRVITGRVPQTAMLVSAFVSAQGTYTTRRGMQDTCFRSCGAPASRPNDHKSKQLILLRNHSPR